jgi:glycosyltransferase involved in cell wall biosynthesis
VGYLPDHEFPALYRLADVYLITSPVELQSIATLEATASGLPVVAVRAAALPELVRDGHNGYLVPPGDWRAASDAVQMILRNESLRATMGAHSRDVSMGHAIDDTVTQYEHFLADVATSK